MNIKTNATFNAKDGTLTLDFDLVGTTELDHELLAAFFEEHLLSETDKLAARIVMKDPNAFEIARHNLENRKRVADGRPTIEQEAAKAAAAKETQAAAEKRAAADKIEVDKARAASQERIEKLAAKEIADRTMAKMEPPKPAAPAPAPVPAPEPKKVQ